MDRALQNGGPNWVRPTLILVAAALVAGAATVGAGTQTFYRDDPLTREVEDQDASRVKPVEIGHESSAWQRIRGIGDRTWRRAMNVNSIDEVPDSSWFTNRISSRRLSIAEIVRGPDTLSGPAEGGWIVLGGKSDGVTPGLQLQDWAGHRFFVKFDPPANPEMASGAEVISTKLLFALGYHVPENYIATVRREDLAIGPGASFKGPDGSKRPMTAEDVDRVLQQAARRPDGSYRVLASLALAGKPVGPFEYQGTRSDDPNDIVPHEHRRELRGLRVFAAWLNHVDTKAENSLDTLVRVGPRTLVRHHLLDFGSTLGSGGTEPMQWRDGYEYAFDKRATVLALLTLGTYTPPWLRIRYPDLPSVGRIDGDHFQPDRWKPTLPNPAFLNARPDDTFWAARRVMAFGDEAIHAVVATARFSDPTAAEYLSQALIKRRDQIGRTWLTDVNPIVDPSVGPSGMLTFRNAAADAGVAPQPKAYRARWSLFDNTTGLTTVLGPWERLADTQCAFPSNLADRAEHVMVEIAATDARHAAWDSPVRVYLARDFERGWSVIGLERLTDVASSGNPQSAQRQQSRRAAQ